jgi:hypothetical protein
MINPAINIFIPDYLQQDVLMQEVHSLVDAGKVVIGNQQDAEYVMRSDYHNDIDIQQAITSPNADNYIYLENRLLFLRHLDAFAGKFHPYIAQALTGVSMYDLVPPSYFVPTAAADITNNIDASKQYAITHSVTGERFVSSDVLSMFTEEMYQTNMQNANFISTDPARGSWVVEELHDHATPTIIKGIACRPKDLATTASMLGVLVEYDTPIEDEALARTITLFVQHTFYYYGTHFELSVAMKDGRLCIDGLRTFVDLQNPRIEKVYCN